MSVFRRGRTWYYHFRRHGQRYTKQGFLTKQAALDAEYDRRRELGALRPQDLGQRRARTFAEAAEEYLTDVVSQKASQRGERYAFTLFLDRWGPRPLDSFTPSDVDAYRTWRAAQPKQRRVPADRKKMPPPVSGAVVNRDLAYLSRFFTWAQAKGYMKEGVNPASRRHVKRFEEAWRPWQTLPPESAETFFAAFPAHERPRAELLLELGVRAGVIYQLRWEQIDLPNRLAHWTSKGRSGVIPLSERAVAILKDR